MGSCAICCESYTAVVRRPAACPFCDHTCCLDCVKTYILSIPDDVHCMACKRPWSHDFVDAILPKAWRNGPLREHRSLVLFEREKRLLPAAQPMADQTRHNRRMRDEISVLQEHKRHLQWRMHRVQEQIWAKSATIRNPAVAVADVHQAVRPCPAPGCRGFVDDASWRCGTCNARICSACFEVKGDEHHQQHVCDPRMVETARALLVSTKPCPGCSARISKVEGCDQMWCTLCHTAFSWETGAVVTGVLHNPHYYEWRRQNGGLPRAPGDIPCGGLPNLSPLVAPLWRNHPRVASKFVNAHTTLDKLLHREAPRLRAAMQVDNSDLRIAYLLNEISEEQWKAQLHRRDRRRVKYSTLFDIVDMLGTAGLDIFQKAVPAITEEDNAARQHVAGCADELDRLREYANGQFVHLAARFECRAPVLDDDWEYHS